jgi:predicted neuraminidase
MQARQTAKRVGGLLAVAVVFGGLFAQTLSAPAPSGFAVSKPSAVRDADRTPLYDERYASSAATPSVHAATALPVPGGMRAFWYGGTREGAGDVAIYSALYEQATSRWSPERPVATRTSTQAGLGRYIRKLGNPVVSRDARGRLWLYYVSVSVGGWSMSSINAMMSADHGATWSAPRRLVTSPFLNISTLVKGRPYLHEDGSLGLPAYHELFGKFGELVRLDNEANVIGKTRLSRGSDGIQPAVAVRSASEAIAFMRYTGGGPGRVLAVRTRDGGRTWSEPEKLSVPNPNAAVDAAALPSGELLLVFNNRPQDRNNLSLAVSSDAGASWRVVHAFEDDPLGDRSVEFSYPWLAQDSEGGRLHLFYTWRRSHIKHVRFDEDWLRQRR